MNMWNKETPKKSGEYIVLFIHVINNKIDDYEILIRKFDKKKGWEFKVPDYWMEMPDLPEEIF